jgi:hypothetical protein
MDMAASPAWKTGLRRKASNMKIRRDFITNSSSSCFVCWGICTYNKEEFAGVDNPDAPFEVGGSDRQFMGITMGTLLGIAPMLSIENIKKFVAGLFNEYYHTNFTEKDISFIEEGWYNG